LPTSPRVVCHKAVQFEAKLGKMFDIPERTYEFQVVKTYKRVVDFGVAMIQSCKSWGMKPVCYDKVCCKSDPNALYIGNFGLISHRVSRFRDQNFPSGWAEIRRQWDVVGLCVYTGKEKPGKANCVNPFKRGLLNWKSLGDDADSFVCGRILKNHSSNATRFEAKLGKMFGIPARTYEFQVVETDKREGGFSDAMIQSCNSKGMKPVCNNPNSCKSDPKALYIGQQGSMSDRPRRFDAKYFPGGWAKIRSQWDVAGRCFYTGQEKPGKALCNTASGRADWKSLGDDEDSFVCGRILRNHSSEMPFEAKLGKMFGIPERTYEFQVVETDKREGGFGDAMIQSCNSKGMKPVCNDWRSCKSDPKALYIGQLEGEMCSRGQRFDAWRYPSGWTKIRSQWEGQGLCFYERNGSEYGAKCNNERYGTFKNLGDDAHSFICGRVLEPGS